MGFQSDINAVNKMVMGLGATSKVLSEQRKAQASAEKAEHISRLKTGLDIAEKTYSTNKESMELNAKYDEALANKEAAEKKFKYAMSTRNRNKAKVALDYANSQETMLREQKGIMQERLNYLNAIRLGIGFDEESD